MRAIYAFYSKPFGSIDIRNARTHWAFPYIEFLVLAYSVSKSKSFGFETVLFCDDYGKELIIDTFKIPFDIVKVELNDIEIKPKFWASGKIYAYSKGIESLGKFEPFVFFDNDAGFHKQPPPHFMTSKYRCQHVYHNHNDQFQGFVNKIIKETKNEFPFDIYHESKGNIDGLKGGNAGMVVINDEKLWSEWTRYSQALVNHEYFDSLIPNGEANPFKKISLWNVTIEENLMFLLNRRLNFELPQTVLEFNTLLLKEGTHNPTEYFHIWGLKVNKEFLKKYEKIAVEYLPKELTDRIYKHFQ
jgi:hypothetical protein